ncbi:heat shock 70 kDa protein 12A-like [Saccostrea cucullata]|uniref:heat shock 70 kDa protein 12A-like n=1 Tax=Saccostrea cuccullata TaxID=36930 RepID=UPI002ED5A804
MEHDYPIPVYVVESCPQNKADWDLRSRQLNCSNDDTKTHRYHCVPNGQKTALLEFCYDVIRPLVQKDNCMELAQSGTLNQHWCKNFLSGCPEKYYYSDESYLYPNCSRINLYGKCYVADPSCEFASTTIASVTETIISTGMSLSENINCAHLESSLTIVSTILSFLIVLSCLTNIVILNRKRIPGQSTSCLDPKDLPCSPRKEDIENVPAGENPNDSKYISVKTTKEDQKKKNEETTKREKLAENEPMLREPPYHSASDDKEEDIENVLVGENPNDLQYVSVTTKQGQDKRNEDGLDLNGKGYKKKIGASIELGTTNSGYCYSYYEQFWKDPVGSIILNKWYSSELETLRTGTEILLDKNLNCINFGYEAENSYAERDAENIQEEYYFFSKFIKDLSKYFRKDKTRSKHVLHAVNAQKEFDAMDIVAKAIEYIMKEIFNDLNSRGYKKEDINMHWVLTVSSLWNNKGKQFLCDCATKAGISRQALLIVTETDALVMYSRYSEIWGSNTKDILKCGTKVMVLDIGGSVMNVTIHEADFNGSLKFLKAYKSVDCGGNDVDNMFKKLLSVITGEQKLVEYEKEFTSDYLEMFRAFEIRKRQARSGRPLVNIRLPLTFMNFCKRHNRDMNIYLEQKFGESVRCYGDNLKIDKSEFEKLFEDTVKKLVNEAEFFYKKESDTKLILMVGGFSNFYLLQNRIGDTFSNKCRILFEDNPEIAVLRGSVLYSHQPHVYRMIEKDVIE